MGNCQLKVRGLSFVVEEFLKTSSLKPQVVYRRGEVLPPDLQTCSDSGFVLTLGDEDTHPLSFHIKEAIRFLTVYEPEFKRAYKCGATDLRMVLSYDKTDLFVQTEYLPPKLLLLAGVMNIGIEISFTQIPNSSPG